MPARQRDSRSRRAAAAQGRDLERRHGADADDAPVDALDAAFVSPEFDGAQARGQGDGPVDHRAVEAPLHPGGRGLEGELTVGETKIPAADQPRKIA